MTGPQVLVAHTGRLDGALLSGARRLLATCFDDLTDSDWEHCLGGMHALAIVDGEVVGHAALVQRRLLHDGRALRAGYVEGVAVHADLRRSGIGNSLMAPLERIGRSAYDLVALGASDEGAAFYRARGWQQWCGQLWALTPAGIVRTASEDGCVYVLPGGGPLPRSGDLTCDYRDGELW